MHTSNVVAMMVRWPCGATGATAAWKNMMTACADGFPRITEAVLGPRPHRAPYYRTLLLGPVGLGLDGSGPGQGPAWVQHRVWARAWTG